MPVRRNGVERKRGNRLGIWFFQTAARLTGLKGAYGLLYIVCTYYLLDLPLVRETLPYIRRRFPTHGPLRRLFDLYLLFVSQGKCLLDRFAIAAGYDGIGVDIVGYDRLRELLTDDNRGFILLTAHVGSWQVAMSSLDRFDRDVCAMMRPEDNAAVREALELGTDSERIRVILTSGALGGVVEALQALESGALVTIMGDRPYDFPSVGVQFLGGEVRFPHGAFTLAAAARCPVVVLLSAKVAAYRYVVDVGNIIPPPEKVRGRGNEAITAAVQRYAHILQEYVETYPLQWFVFRDIWKERGGKS